MSGIILPFEKNEDFLLNIHDIYADNFPKSPWSKKYFIDFFSNAKRESIGFYIKDSDKIAGFVLGRKSLDGNSFNLSTLWVVEKYRGLGYGKLLVEKIIDTVEERNLARIIVVHFREENDLEKFYAKCGFFQHKIVKMYSNGDKKHQMELLLNEK